MEKILGKWKVTKMENYSALLDLMGVSGQQKQMLSEARPEFNYRKDGETWTLNFSLGPQLKQEIHFKLGEEFTTTGLLNEEVKVIISWDGNRFVETSTRPLDPDTKLVTTREFEGNQMIAILNVKDTTAKLYHEKVQ